MAVPWVQILKWAPQIIGVSRDLLQKSRRAEPPRDAAGAADPRQLASRIAALEDTERHQAELLERMASQQAELVQAVVALHRQARLLWFVIAVLGVATAVLASLLLGR